MKININELTKTKTMQINCFKGNKIYSFNSGVEVITICELSDVNFTTPFAIDSKAFDLIKKFNTPELELKDNQLIVKEGKRKFTTQTLNFELPQYDLNEMLSCNVDLEILKRARKFTSNNMMNRPILTSVNLKENGNIYATDSYTLYRYEKVKEDDTTFKGINIPNTFIDLLDKNITDEKTNLKIHFNSKCILVKKDNITFIGRLIVGDFPNIKSTLECYCPDYFNCDYEELKDNILFANNVGASKDNNANIICRFRNNNLKCYGASEYETEIESITKSGDFEISIVIDFLQLLLNCVEKDVKEIKLKFNGSYKPIKYQDENQTIMFTPIRKMYED